jgi:hypothetical protein
MVGYSTKSSEIWAFIAEMVTGIVKSVHVGSARSPRGVDKPWTIARRIDRQGPKRLERA